MDKAYRAYDPQNLKYVFRHDFINVSMAHQLEFSEEELSKIFDVICDVKLVKGLDQQVIA